MQSLDFSDLPPDFRKCHLFRRPFYGNHKNEGIGPISAIMDLEISLRPMKIEKLPAESSAAGSETTKQNKQCSILRFEPARFRWQNLMSRFRAAYTKVMLL